MIIDSHSLSDGNNIRSDLCIVGAGIAGIPLAKEFLDTNISVSLIESGGLKPAVETQSLNAGNNVGVPYYYLDQTRARAFGGTSHMWICDLGGSKLGVRLMGLDEIDFEKRDWVPNSGWPFTKKELDPYYEKAHTFCEIGPYSYSIEGWKNILPDNDRALLPSDSLIQTRIFQFARKELWYEKYKNIIQDTNNITAYINATVLNIVTDESGNSIERLDVGTLDGKRFRFFAKRYIIAAGAIETARIMLLSNSVHRDGLGNMYDNVGRYFMEHPHIWTGYIIPSNKEIFNRINLYDVHTVNNTPIMGKLAIDSRIQKKEHLLNFVTSIHPANKTIIPEEVIKFRRGLGKLKRGKIVTSELVQSAKKSPAMLAHVVKGLRRKIDKKYDYQLKQPNVLVMNPMAEQIPNRESRVTLNNECDAFGQKRASLNWQLTTQDINSIRRSQQIIGSELRRNGIGEMIVELTDDSIPPRIHGGWHNMGTTRMHIDPRQGVVDENCKVHGLSNLYIAGPSVFPTVGCANPVLTIIAMSMRLADHLKSNRSIQ
jgi:choline dehydrogenase-like flavoprotein